MRQLWHGLCMCAIQRVKGRTKDLSSFERVMIVGAWWTGLCQELQRCWVYHTKQFPVCIENGPPPKRTSSQLDITLGSIGVNIGQHSCGHLGHFWHLAVLSTRSTSWNIYWNERSQKCSICTKTLFCSNFVHRFVYFPVSERFSFATWQVWHIKKLIKQHDHYIGALWTIKVHSKLCSFVTQHNATNASSFEGACNWHADCRNVHQSCCWMFISLP